jgi:tetratricopeptide (TPR) repeat protein
MFKFNLSKIIKSKLESYSKSYLEQAKIKCNEAKSILDSCINDFNIESLNKSMELYKQAIEIYPNLAEPYISISFIYWKLKNFEKAESFISQALEMEPSNPYIKDLIAKINNDKKNTQFETYQSFDKKTSSEEKKGILSKLTEIFTVPKFTGFKKKFYESDEKYSKNHSYIDSLNKLNEVVKQNEIKPVEEKETLEKISPVKKEVSKIEFNISDGELSVEESLSVNTFQFTEDNISKSIQELEKLKENITKENFKVKVNNHFFDRLKGENK